MTAKRSFHRKTDPVDMELEAYIRESLRTPGYEKQTQEQMLQYALQSKEAFRSKLPELLAAQASREQASLSSASGQSRDIPQDPFVDTDDPGCTSKPAFDPASLSSSRKFRFFRSMRIAVPAAALVLVAVVATCLQSKGNYNPELVVTASDSGQLHFTSGTNISSQQAEFNPIFQILSSQIGCPQLSSTSEEVSCTKLEIYGDSSFSYMIFSYNDTSITIQIEKATEDYSKRMTFPSSYIESIPIDNSHSFEIYSSVDSDGITLYSAYLQCDGYLYSVDSSASYEPFIEFLQSLSLVTY